VSHFPLHRDMINCPSVLVNLLYVLFLGICFKYKHLPDVLIYSTYTHVVVMEGVRLDILGCCLYLWKYACMMNNNVDISRNPRILCSVKCGSLSCHIKLISTEHTWDTP
jgi:hypothetical protein